MQHRLRCKVEILGVYDEVCGHAASCSPELLALLLLAVQSELSLLMLLDVCVS